MFQEVRQNRVFQDVVSQVEEASFDAILQRWQQTLHALADAFAAGDARVDPVDLRKTCRDCDLIPLCRIHDRHAEAGRGGDDD